MVTNNVPGLRVRLNADRALNISSDCPHRAPQENKRSCLRKSLIAALLLIGTAASTASAQYSPPTTVVLACVERGYYGHTVRRRSTNMTTEARDQYGYGPGYSYARQAPDSKNPRTSRLRQRGTARTTHEMGPQVALTRPATRSRAEYIPNLWRSGIGLSIARDIPPAIVARVSAVKSSGKRWSKIKEE